MDDMTAVKRVRTALQLGVPDRVPMSFAIWSMEPLSRDENRNLWWDPQKLAQAAIHTSTCNNHQSDETALSYLNLAMIEALGAEIDYSKFWPGVKSHMIHKIEDYEKLWILDPYKDGRLPVLVKQMELVSQAMGEKMFLWGQEFSPFTFLFQMSEATQAVVDMVYHPNVIKKTLEIITQSIIELMKALAKSGANGFRLNAQRWDRAFFSKDHIREFDFPYVSKIFAEAKKLNLPTKMFVELPNPHIDLMLELKNLDCFEFLDTAPHTRSNEIPRKWVWEDLDEVDLKNLREMLRGKLCLSMPAAGRPIMERGTPEEVEVAIKKWLRIMGEGGGFTLKAYSGAGGSWGSKDNAQKAIETVYKHGKYPIRIE